MARRCSENAAVPLLSPLFDFRTSSCLAVNVSKPPRKGTPSAALRTKDSSSVPPLELDGRARKFCKVCGQGSKELQSQITPLRLSGKDLSDSSIVISFVWPPSAPITMHGKRAERRAQIGGLALCRSLSNPLTSANLVLCFVSRKLWPSALWRRLLRKLLLGL